MASLEKTLKGLECCKKLSAEDPFSGCDDCPYNEISVAVEECREALSADALKLLKEQKQIVHCKDCKHGDKCNEPHEDYWCTWHETYNNSEWFCADGERMGEK